MKKESLKFDGWIITAVILVAFAILIILIPSLANKIWDVSKFNTKGEMASYIYGISTPFIGLATIILIGRTYWLQKKQLDDTMNSLKRQSFEDTFFKLLENHHRIIEAMTIIQGNASKQILASKRECFKYIYDELGVQVASSKTQEPITSEGVNKLYNKCQDTHKSLLHNYFRFIYHILKFVKNAEGIDNKMQYTNILRATLSPYELVLLYYNGMHEFGIESFLPLIEEFSFLKNYDTTLIFLEDKKGIYHDLAFASVEKRRILLPLWKKEQALKQEAILNVTN